MRWPARRSPRCCAARRSARRCAKASPPRCLPSRAAMPCRDFRQRACRGAGPCAGAAGSGMRPAACRMETDMTPETARPFIDIRRRWPRRWPRAARSWRWKAPSSRMACPIPHNSAMAANVEKIIAGRRRGAGDDRRHRRPAQDRAFRRRARIAGHDGGRHEAVARRSRLCGRRSAAPAARRSPPR